jgi:hypothetical protein
MDLISAEEGERRKEIDMISTEEGKEKRWI